ICQCKITNFGEFCSIVGQEATEKLLIPKFFDLCSDSLWGIRKACAECFMMVSNSTSPEVRRAKLSPLFISLISDQSRWVRQAAFQSLGRFISTFANPTSAGLHFREDGGLLDVTRCTSDRIIGHNNLSETFNRKMLQFGPIVSIREPHTRQRGALIDCSLNSLNCADISGRRTERTIAHTPPNQDGRATPSPEHVPAAEEMNYDDNGHSFAHGESLDNLSHAGNNARNAKDTTQADENFNSFHFWRPPLPDISEPHMDDPDVQGE
uniref:Uncharacterized protein n=1 Tax=Hippocampus comes TaxID=109280 RepID=A0A3Q2XK83_HIPCM